MGNVAPVQLPSSGLMKGEPYRCREETGRSFIPQEPTIHTTVDQPVPSKATCPGGRPHVLTREVCSGSLSEPFGVFPCGSLVLRQEDGVS